MSKYKLQIKSKLPEFDRREIVQHTIDGRNHIGVWGDEPFLINFRNDSSEKVQVRLSLDGTDILTGEPASIASNGRMWVVQPWGVLELEAWPETNESGARFVFRSEQNSVALHTHGDMSQKGTIAAAVYTERYSPSYPITYNGMYGSDMTKGGGVLRSHILGRSSVHEMSLNDTRMDIDRCSERTDASVGAGETVKQSIKTASGLTQPKLSQVVTLNYLWWDDLRAKLAEHAAREAQPRPSGFKDYSPTYKMANLKNTPRLDRVEGTPRVPAIQPIMPDFFRIY